jgi:hypothetical protein
MHGDKNWGATISALVPGRVENIVVGDGRVSASTRRLDVPGDWTYRYGYGAWIEDKAEGFVTKTHGGKDWIAIAVLVPVERKLQYSSITQ